MRQRKQLLVLAAVFFVALIAAPALYADDSHEPSGPMKKGGMMGQGGMTGGASRMMNGCGSMMQGGGRGGRPNDQWRKDAPAPSDKDG